VSRFEQLVDQGKHEKVSKKTLSPLPYYKKAKGAVGHGGAMHAYVAAWFAEWLCNTFFGNVKDLVRL